MDIYQRSKSYQQFLPKRTKQCIFSAVLRQGEPAGVEAETRLGKNFPLSVLAIMIRAAFASILIYTILFPYGCSDVCLADKVWTQPNRDVIYACRSLSHIILWNYEVKLDPVYARKNEWLMTITIIHWAEKTDNIKKNTCKTSMKV